jgi:hypothetical protein
MNRDQSAEALLKLSNARFFSAPASCDPVRRERFTRTGSGFVVPANAGIQVCLSP